MSELIKLSEQELKALQRKNLEITQYLVDFCRAHGLRVFIFAGSALGAVRHQGFVPWDDDMDLVMPPLDYLRLVELWEKEADTERYSLCYTSRHYNDHHLSASVRDNHSTFVTLASVDTDTNQGVGVDLLPLHAAARTRLGRALQLVCACGCSLFKAARLPNRQSRGVYLASRLLLGLFRGEGVRYFIWSSLEKLATIPDRHYEQAQYVKEFSMFPCITWLYPRTWFDTAEWLPFEDTVLPVPAGCREYLVKRYGDYMTPPPEEDRRPEHKLVFLDLERSWREYRGIAYYKNKP